jgi:hypothetical protein
MAIAALNLAATEQQALTALVAGRNVANMLSPGGAVGAAVGDILAAAGQIVPFINTVDAALATFTSPRNDPIAASFSSGQPYGGTFITSPTVTQLTPVDFSQLQSTSTQLLSQLSPAQQAALSAQTGVVLTSDADLAIAMAAQFDWAQTNLKLAFSIDLTDTEAITPAAPVTATTTTSMTANGSTVTTATSTISGGIAAVGGLTTTRATTVTVPPLTANPNVAAMSAFAVDMVGSFPNTPGLAGVVASVWVDGLGVSVSSTGIALSGVPSDIAGGIYTDITNAAAGMVPAAVPVTIVDYSTQQNRFNVLVALAIDHGLSSTLATLMTADLVTPASRQVIKNRLVSVAQRGDAAMLSTLCTALGANNIPGAAMLLTTLLTNLQPSDQAAAISSLTITASGIALSTTGASLTTAQLVTYIEGLLALAGLTIEAICCQSTCNSTFCSQSLLNVSLIKRMNPAVIEALLDPMTVQMAMMFDP